MMTKPSKLTFATIVVLAVFLTTIFFAVFAAIIAHADPIGDSQTMSSPFEHETSELAILEVDRGIRFFLRQSPCWGLAMDGRARREMAEKIAKAAADNGVPPLLLTLMAKRESSFSPEAIGFSRGEIGILQVHGLAARGCDLDTVEGQLDCGARWLRRSFNKCGAWDRAIANYASGNCTIPKKGAVARIVLSRFRQWQKARDAVEGCDMGKTDHWICQPQKRTCNEAIGIIARERTGKDG